MDEYESWDSGAEEEEEEEEEEKATDKDGDEDKEATCPTPWLRHPCGPTRMLEVFAFMVARTEETEERLNFACGVVRANAEQEELTE